MQSLSSRGRRPAPSRVRVPATGWVTILFLILLAIPWVREGTPFRWGLDLSGGVRVVYRPDWSGVAAPDGKLEPRQVLDVAKDTLASRLARSLGAVPDVAVRSDDRIVVTIPGEDDQRRVLDLVGETYRLTFRLVEPPSVGGTRDPAVEVVRFSGRDLPLGPTRFSGEMLDARHLRVVVPQAGATTVGGFDPRGASAEVAFRFQPPFDRDFESFTREHVGRELAILIDDGVEWVGRIESTIPGEGTLAGGYSVEEARRVADMLRAGTLPIRLDVEDLESVGPSLGQELRHLGWRALVFGILSVLAMTWIAYRHQRVLRVAGLESLICLLATVAGLVSSLGLTVDLAAIAGLILSVGMGLDAFILVFETLATEPRAPTEDRSWSSRVRRAYGIAREGGTLLHANATSLIVVGLLARNERLGSFAVFIAIGILASLITIVATRHRLLASRTAETRPTETRTRDVLAPLRRARPRLFRYRPFYAGLLLAILGAFAFTSITDGGMPLRLGADFAPGTQIVFSSPDDAAARATLDALAEQFPDASSRHQRMGRGSHLVTLGTTLTVATPESPDVPTAASVNQRIRASGSEPESLHAIDPRVAGRRLESGLSVLGLGFASLGVYLVGLQPMIDRLLGARGTVQSARARGLVFLGVVSAVVLDVVLALATLGFAGIAIDLPVVAALLAIIGYSVNDSVVLANQIARRGAVGVSRAAANGIVEEAIDRILSRTVLTSLTTLMPAIAILAVGLEPLRAFAWVIVIGVAAGTLSSMFVVGSFAARALRLPQPETPG